MPGNCQDGMNLNSCWHAIVKKMQSIFLSLQDRCVKMHMERMSIYVVWLNLLITAVITVIIVESGIAIVMHAGTG